MWTVQYINVPYIWYGEQCSKLRYCTQWYVVYALRCSTVLHNIMQYSTVQYHTVILYGTVQSSVQYGTEYSGTPQNNKCMSFTAQATGLLEQPTLLYYILNWKVLVEQYNVSYVRTRIRQIYHFKSSTVIDVHFSYKIPTGCGNLFLNVQIC